MYNVHEDAPVTFQTRWTMSYLAGPLTRTQIKTLMDPRRPRMEHRKPRRQRNPQRRLRRPRVRPRRRRHRRGPLPSAVAAAAAAAAGATVLPAEIPQYYLPLRGATPGRPAAWCTGPGSWRRRRSTS